MPAVLAGSEAVQGIKPGELRREAVGPCVQVARLSRVRRVREVRVAGGHRSDRRRLRRGCRVVHGLLCESARPGFRPPVQVLSIVDRETEDEHGEFFWRQWHCWSCWRLVATQGKEAVYIVRAASRGRASGRRAALRTNGRASC